MSLSQRQRKAHTELGSVWRPSAGGTVDPTTKERNRSGVGGTAVYTGMPCLVQAAKEVLDPSVIGLQVHDNMDTLDVLIASQDYVLDTNDYFRQDTPGHPYEGTWYIIQGPVQSRAWRAKSSTWLMKKATAAPGWHS